MFSSAKSIRSIQFRHVPAKLPFECDSYDYPPQLVNAEPNIRQVTKAIREVI